MSINIKDLRVTGEKEVIRESIQTPQGAIEIYEPTMEQITEIVKLGIEGDEEQAFEEGRVQYDADMLINFIFPMITNISLEGLSKEELQKVIEEPSIHLIMAQQVVEGIIHESMKLYALRMMSELKSAESNMAQVELLNTIPQYVLEVARSEGKSSELVDNYKEVSDKVEAMLKSEEATKNAEEVETKE